MSFIGFVAKRKREEVRKKLIKNKQCLADRKNKRIDVRCVVKLCVKIDNIDF